MGRRTVMGACVMCEMRLPDCRPARRDGSSTPASSHPELISGDLAMPPRVHASLASADRTAVPAWSRRLMIGCVVVTGALVLYANSVHHIGTKLQAAGTGGPTLASSCEQWHEAASAALARLAQSTSDSDLRQINDAVFRLRRARRNCEEGSLNLACQDYYSVARSMPRYAAAYDESLFPCRGPAN
jgi:hypothetical protein